MIDHLRTLATHRIYTMPVLVLMPHSRCNCRCVMCDIWKANNDKREISTEELERHISSFRKLSVKHVTLSGGEALMHANLWRFCDQLRAIGAEITLLSTGLLLGASAKDVVTHCHDVIVSLDGSRETHNRIRNIPAAFEKMESGIRALREIEPAFRVTGRCVLQKSNFRDLPGIINAAKQLRLDSISFLTADVSSLAFNHASALEKEKRDEIVLTLPEIDEFTNILEKSFVDFRNEYSEGFIVENKNRMLAFAGYYRAVQGKGTFTAPKCNAPWVSAVVESNGDVMPCFFQAPYGNLAGSTFDEVVNSDRAISFRRDLKIAEDSICQKCVCSLHRGILQS